MAAAPPSPTLAAASSVAPTQRGRVQAISEDGPPPLATYAYDVDDRRVSRTLENGVTTAYGYDTAHQLLNVTHSHGSTPLQTRDYLYNTVGNRTAMQSDGTAWDVYGFDTTDQPSRRMEARQTAAQSGCPEGVRTRAERPNQLTSVKYSASSSSGATPARTVRLTHPPPQAGSGCAQHFVMSVSRLSTAARLTWDRGKLSLASLTTCQIASPQRRDQSIQKTRMTGLHQRDGRKRLRVKRQEARTVNGLMKMVI